MKILREEFFGAILYDTDSFTYKLIDKNEKKNIKADKIIPLDFTPERKDILSAPVRIYFEFTGKCNLACRYCFTSSSPEKETGMSTEMVKSLLEDMKNSGVINVRFTGGEPTIRPDWYEVLTYAKSLGLVVAISSNGVFEDMDKTVSQILSLDIEQITFSIDGLETAHDYIRGKGTFKKIKRALEKLKISKALRLTTILTKLNVKEIPEIVEFAGKYVKIINFVFLRSIGRGIRYKELLLSFEELYESARLVKELQKKYSDLLIFHSANPLPKEFLKPDKASGLSFAASYANTSLAVSYDGKIWPHHYGAHMAPELILGTHPENSIKDIWFKSKKLDSFRSWTGKLQDRCFLCDEYGKRCAGYNFEMEFPGQSGKVKENPYCVKEDTVTFY